MPTTIANEDISMEDLKIKFDGATQQIEANTLINSLIHFTNITQEINAELKTDRKIEIKINAHEPGSFIVHLFIESTLIDAVKNLFTHENIAHVKDIIFLVSNVYKLAKFLKGKAPKKFESIDNSIRIENNSGDVTVFDNRTFTIYNNSKIIREAISSEFETLNQDLNVTGFELLDRENKPLVEITKQEFEAMASSEETVKETNERDLTKTGIINISSLSFEPNAKWTFYWEGNRFTAKIDDTEFRQRIDKGEKFSKGDSLEVEFEIRQEFNDPANTYVNKSYKILRIIRHIPRADQTRLDI